MSCQKAQTHHLLYLICMEKHQKNKEKSEEQAYKIHLVNRQFIKYLMRVAINN